MRPVTRGASPRAGDFKRYKEANDYLLGRIGPFCSYCERRIPEGAGLAVEHIQPKKLPQYAHLELAWDNFLLGCINCNSTKGKKDVLLDQFLLPDRDNTFAALEYHQNGEVSPAAGLDAHTREMAVRTLELTGQNTQQGLPRDPNLRLVAKTRIQQRAVTWSIAKRALENLHRRPDDEMREVIVELAVARGFFSIWMKVFEQESGMRRRFIDAFTGTAADCFDAATLPISPRPANGLAHGGKI